VTYTDAENNAPSYVRVYINSVFYSMSKQNAGDVNYADGCVYAYSTLLSPVSHHYYFSTSDGYASASTSTRSGPTVVNSAPTVTVDQVLPERGTTSTYFSFIVVYTDVNNNPPSTIGAIINGTLFPMTRVNVLDDVYTDGCAFVFGCYLTSQGYYTYKFSASDGYASVESDMMLGPIVRDVNSAPVFSSPTVSPSSGSPTTTYTFSIQYSDGDNDSPINVRICIDGNNYTMHKKYVGDNIYSDGCLYTYETALSPGTHEYFFVTSDGWADTSTPVYQGPEVSTSDSAFPLEVIAWIAAIGAIAFAILAGAITKMKRGKIKNHRVVSPVRDRSTDTEPEMISQLADIIAGVKTILLDGYEVDIVSDLRQRDLSACNLRWFSGSSEEFIRLFKLELEELRNVINIPELKAIDAFRLVQSMIAVFYGTAKAEEGQQKSIRTAKRLFEDGFIDPALPAPGLTAKGLALRRFVLQLSSRQIEIIRTPDFIKVLKE
jgi:hypothetical protein